ncbi:hypothetical protein [Hymenobacter tenuis]
MKAKAYNEQWIFNGFVQKAARRWRKSHLLSDAHVSDITQAFPDEHYSPHLFIKITLFIFTCIGSAGASLLFFLSVLGSFSNGNSSVDEESLIMSCSLLCSVFAFILLETLIVSKRLYRSGVDNALLYIALGFGVAALLYFYNKALIGSLDLEGSLVRGVLWQLLLPVWFLLLVALVRYADPLVGAVSFGVYLAIVVAFMLPFALGKALLPFALMLATVGSYYTTTQLARRADYPYYQTCLRTLKVLALACFYLAGNYLVVREANALLNNLSVSVQISFAPLFYVFTAAIPVLYIYRGLRHFDRIFLHTGLVALAFSLYTYRFYRQLLPPEVALTLGGALLIVVAGWALRYLRSTRHGLTSQPADSPEFSQLNLEALVMSHVTENQLKAPEPSFQFGGGTSGGGGADGNY